MSSAPLAFVTGGASGIGLATVKRLAEGGYQVVAVDCHRERLDALVSSSNDAITTCLLDITDRGAVASAIAALPRIDALVCVAGIYQPRRWDEISDDDFQLMLNVNLLGTFIPMQEAARRMTPGSRIVTVSSRAAIGGIGFAHYVASKAAIIGLTRALAMELKERQISVNSVAPGFTDTPMTRSMPEDQYAAAQALEPTGKAADPADIAEVITFLAAPSTRFITGQTIFVDGGKSLGGLAI